MCRRLFWVQEIDLDMCPRSSSSNKFTHAQHTQKKETRLKSVVHMVGFQTWD